MTRGRRIDFHGAYGTKAKAQRKQRATPGASVSKVKVKGKTRYLVMTRRDS
jgi:hypothetical protein